MFSRHSPLKRKHSEYHDPDYPQQEEQNNDDDGDGKPGCSKHFAAKIQKSGDEIETKKEMEREIYYHNVREVIAKEFQKEIVMKQEQLEEISARLEKAKHLLERLRYAIVSAYYKKQEIPVTSADAATLRGPNSLFDREEKGPQMPLHPSLKKLIGKRPKDLSEVIRTCPKRTAAQNAVQTIRAKSQSQKKEERKLKQIIRDQGIVIDHSKQNVANSDVNTLLNAAAQNTLINSHNNVTANKVKETSSGIQASSTSGKALNAARLNNKIKHLIVVGNTSKYIGNEAERDIKPQSQNLTHKWLVYVQSKETKQPIDRFVKKVRFHLHHSYRPNDVVDVNSPPFQVSRRGWGEFPIRVELFFQSEYHQKPIQLVHNIVLDKTLSGIQTLGAETLLEIWLRDTKAMNSPRKEEEKEHNIIKKPEIASKEKNNLISRTDELVDDNLLEFLNKIEASPCSISADIEKIQPTVVVTEPLNVKLKTASPEKTMTSSLSDLPTIPQKSPAFSNDISVPTTTTTAIISEPETFKTPLFTNSSLTSTPMTTYVKLSTSNSQVKFINTTTTASNNFSNMPPLRPITPNPVTSITTVSSSNVNQLITSTIQKTPMVLNKDGKMLMPSASVASTVRRTILPIGNNAQANVATLPSQIQTQTQTQKLNKNLNVVNKPQIISVSTAAAGTTTLPAVPKQILQKKLVQLVDANGKVKYIQMLVAASAAPSSVQNINAMSVAPKLITMAPSSIKSSTVTNITQITNTITTPLLKSNNGNGTYLTPAMTMKPNIFKIVPESMQTKPQVITFSTTAATIAATNINTSIIAHNQQQAITTTTRTISQITSAVATTPITTKSNNSTLAVASKMQRHNGNSVTKNLVFQREGKLYIIDPQQMKYKQQQKKQVSLLKPQISLLKQQHQQQLQKMSTLPSTTENSNAMPVMKPKLETKSCLAQTTNNYAPQVHYGLKQQRINSMNVLQLLQMKKVLFEKQFYRQEFNNMRSAVEFLLRRLKLVASKDSLVSAFPFVCHTLQEFHSLTAFKQRAYEWLRAKNINRLMRNHKDLQNINQRSKEIFWSTKEIATFARRYAYTPLIKSLPRPGEQTTRRENGSNNFMDLVKSELKQEHHLQYDTLTDQQKVRKWIDKIWQTLEDYEQNEDEHQIIDIVGITEEEKNVSKCIGKAVSPSKHYPLPTLDLYIPPPPQLEHSCELVSDICKDLSIKLSHEELDIRVYHQSSRTVLAQCLHLFIEKILRQSIALKQENNHSSSVADSTCTILPQDLAKVIATSSEFDFLTNNNFGSTSMAECLMSSIVKQEKS